MMTNKFVSRTVATFVAAAGLGATAANAGEPSGKMVMPEPAPAPEPWTICNLFDYSTLYENDSNPFIQEFSLIGRYHGQWHYTDGSAASDDGWEDRRWRFGAEAKLFNNVEVQAQFNLNPEFNDRFFEDLEEATIAWEPSDSFYLIVGKQKPKITQEYSTSSKRIITFERSLLVNQLVPDKTGGVVVGGEVGMMFWETGIFTGGEDEDWDLPEFDAGIGAMGRFGVHATEATDIRFDYFYNDGDAGNDGFEDQENTFSLNSTTKLDGFGLNTDLIYATGGIENDVYGLVIMPYVDITDKLQGVFRYQFAGSDGNDGIRLQSRYERPGAAGGERGDTYHAFYGGLNYRICGDKLKLMGGVEYSTLDGESDYDGITYLAGIRLYF